MERSVGVCRQGYIGEQASDDVEDPVIMMHAMKLLEVNRGFVLSPRRWVVERIFTWMTHFRRLAADFERLHKTVAGLRLVVFACTMSARCFAMSAQIVLIGERHVPARAWHWTPNSVQK